VHLFTHHFSESSLKGGNMYYRRVRKVLCVRFVWNFFARVILRTLSFLGSCPVFPLLSHVFFFNELIFSFFLFLTSDFSLFFFGSFQSMSPLVHKRVVSIFYPHFLLCFDIL